MLLAFESVARTASACLCDDSGRVVAMADSAGREAEIVLVGMLDGLIRAHGLPRALAVAVGPGSFTGLRIAVTAARTLGYLEGLPVHGVDTLVARAMQEGDGLWWVLMPLKRDTTFHALCAVERGVARILAPSIASLDAEVPVLGQEHTGAVAIGPALTTKPQLAGRWCPGIRIGSTAPLSAVGVAAAARGCVPLGWEQILPAYHQEPAPVLQRRQQAERVALSAVALRPLGPA